MSSSINVRGHRVIAEAPPEMGGGGPRPRQRDRCDLGAQFFLWEMAVAGHRLGVNPFDQPNVESAKPRAREMIADYRKTGSLSAETPAGESSRLHPTGDVVSALGRLSHYLQKVPVG